MDRIAVPRNPFVVEQSGDWTGIANNNPLQITGTLTIDENFAYLHRVVQNQNRVIGELLSELRRGGYDKV